MNVNQAIDSLVSLASIIFVEDSEEPIDREGNSRLLRQAVEATLQARGIPLETKMKDELRVATKCKVYVIRIPGADISISDILL
jgi:hypothetical protein